MLSSNPIRRQPTPMKVKASRLNVALTDINKDENLSANLLSSYQYEPQSSRCRKRLIRPFLSPSASWRTLCLFLTIPRLVSPFVRPSLNYAIFCTPKFACWEAVLPTRAEQPSSDFDKSSINIGTTSDLPSLFITPTNGTHLATPSQSQMIDSSFNDFSSARSRRKKYQRKREQPPSEKELDLLKQVRQAEYESAISNNTANSTSAYRSNNNFWAFERLFPEPVWDDDTIRRDLYEVSNRDKKIKKTVSTKEETTPILPSQWKETKKRVANAVNKKGFMNSVKKNLKMYRPPNTETNVPYDPPSFETTSNVDNVLQEYKLDAGIQADPSSLSSTQQDIPETTRRIVPGINIEEMIASTKEPTRIKVDRALTRLVEERMYGYRRTLRGDYIYETSLMGDGAVKFRDGKRLGNPLQVNVDLLNYHAKRELKHGRLEEAEEMYEKAIAMDPKDGRAYLGLSKIAERRRDFAYAKECLKMGISRSISFLESGNAKESSRNNGPRSLNSPTDSVSGFNIPDNGANPFLLQALGTLEEQLGHLTEAEALYVEATKSRPSHAAAWVSLAELRTKKLRQGPNAGRLCFQTAERELKLAKLPQSAYVYTAWASLENRAGDLRRARELFQLALDLDPKCSSAWLQLGVLEANKENWTRAKECFETVLTFDQRNSRVLQAYAIMESKRPDGESREAIELFERALAMNPRDGGVYQAYGLYVAKLGDVDGARNLLRRGTEVDKRHAPLWQAWGVLESRDGSASVARDVFQQGIWACAQSSGGQSGGRHCARLWQAWGVLEAQEKDPAAARRCFNRALDADSRNVAAVIAWTLMEQELGNYKDARLIFERALKQFSSPSDDKMSLWRAYEVMETKAGNVNGAQQVYQRSIKDAILRDDGTLRESLIDFSSANNTVSTNKKTNEVEVVTWSSRTDSGFGGNEVWMADDGSILGKVPSSTMMKKRSK